MKQFNYIYHRLIDIREMSIIEVMNKEQLKYEVMFNEENEGENKENEEKEKTLMNISSANAINKKL